MQARVTACLKQGTICRKKLNHHNMDNYIIFGVGSFLSDIFDIIHANNGRVKKIFQNMPEVSKERSISFEQRIKLLDYEVPVHPLEQFTPEDGCKYVLGCTTVKKSRLIEQLKKEHNITFAQLVHPDASIGSHVHLGEGVVISPKVAVGPNCFLDDFCVIIRSASLGHEVHVGKYARIGPSAALAGNSKVGQKSIVGMSASILDSVFVGAESIIGAGAVVTKDIPDGVVAYGVPAKVIRKND